MKWRRLLVVLHRDFGFFCVGLTLVYAVSGIAVNHREDWDYNYSRALSTRKVGAPAALLGLRGDRRPAGELARLEQDRLVQRLVTVLGRKDPPKKVFWRGADRMSLFFGPAGRDIVDYLPSLGVAEHTQVSARPLVRQLNYLHLNEGRRWWTYVADVYAVLLIFLAVSGAVVVRGRRGLRGWGGVLIAAGIVAPIVAYLLLK